MRTMRWISISLIGAAATLQWGCGTELDPTDDVTLSYSSALAGDFMEPVVASTGTGDIDVALDDDDTLRIEGDFDNLVADLREFGGGAVHLREDTDEETARSLFTFDVEVDDDDRGGSFSENIDLTEDQVQDFRAGRYYITVHSAAYPDGELRAQLNESAPDVSIFDDSWGLMLTTDAQPHDVDSDAEGWMWAILRSDNTVVISGVVDDLTSELVEINGGAVNLHDTDDDEDTGPLLFNLDYEMIDEDSVRFWYTATLSTAETLEMESGDFYVNVITEDNRDGEVRADINHDDRNFFEEIWDDVMDDRDPTTEDPPF
ncbi:CHRD domain-containing protein [Lujinxingia vulgaris]|uniref:CHRD domain-containing protein n=1 Tax=Lujinxingia vulgaris TaxID=2600176 RepID=A0A5C6XLD5_9DELT|nr:CHRD domain-containing protein [Lujinxingia vulgaris]TXD42789.1 CHRD domain-containing protein [Lujinxingia vulgaris]